MAAEKRKLPNVTLAAMTSVNIWATIKAMEYSMRGIAFGDAVLITHKKPFGLPKCIRYSHTDKLNNIDDFNYKMVYELGSHIHTEFVLIVHADGFVVHRNCGGMNFWIMIILARLGRSRQKGIQQRIAISMEISAV